MCLLCFLWLLPLWLFPRSVVFLNRPDAKAFAAECADAVHGGGGACKGGDAGNVMGDCGAADGFLVEEGVAAERGVDDEVDLSALDIVHDVGPAFVDLVNGLDVNAGVSQDSRTAIRPRQAKGDARPMN